MLLCALFSGLALQAGGRSSSRDYLKDLPEESIVKQKCDECKGFWLLRLFYESEEQKACKEYNEFFQDTKQELDWNTLIPRLVTVKSVLGTKGLKKVIDKVIPNGTDDQKAQEFEHSQKLVQQMVDERNAVLR